MIRRFLVQALAPVDGILAGAVGVLMLFGLAVLYSASGAQLSMVISQGRNILVAVMAMWILAHIPPHQLMRLAVPAYALGLLALVGVALFGEISHGARRWLHLGFIRVQPSELMKIALPLLMAWFFQQRENHLRLVDFAMAAVLMLVPVALIARQPDLGTAVLIASSGFYVLFLAGLSWRILLGGGALMAVSLPVLWSALHDYQRQRLRTLLDPNQDPLGAGYHTIQSTIALGSGGIAGKGWQQGTQAHLDFLPERTTDFIFAVFGEEFGLIGELAFLAILLVVVARGLTIAADASTPFARLTAGALSLTLFTYAFVNMGMVSGILPVVGVPLPFLSYGGTSLVTVLIGLGILMSIHHHRKLIKH